MTQQQRDKLQDQMKAWAFPVLLVMVFFFGKTIVNQLGKLVDDMEQVKINQSILRNDVNYIKEDLREVKEDTNRLRVELNEVKKKLTDD